MPIYEYQCEKCKHISQAYQHFSDSPLTKCKWCGGKLHKIISKSTFHLKGKGWYATDYGTMSRANVRAPRAKKKEIKNVQKKV